jgi:uncharacterized membrane protein YdjX (TVP38/TMEM64 family)
MTRARHAARRRRVDRGLLAFAAGIALSLALAAVAVSQGWLASLRVTPTGGDARAAAVYLGLGVLAELLWLPRSWNLVTAGLLFGPWLGIALSAVADLTTAALAYAVARRAGRGGVRDWLARRPRAAALLDSLGRQRAFSTVLALRVLPVHWTATSYAAGLACVPPRAYFAGTALGLLPAAVLFNLAGDALHRRAYLGLCVAAALALALGIAGAAARRRWLPANGPPSDDGLRRVG